MTQNIELEWTLINQEEEFERSIIGLKDMNLGEIILLENYCETNQNKQEEKEPSQPSSSSPSPSSSHSPSSTSKEQLQEKLQEITLLLEKEREINKQEKNLLINELENIKKEKENQENENIILKKERDFFQMKCMESTEGTKIYEHAIIASLHSLRCRINYLTSEARAYRLLEETGGLHKSEILNPFSTSTMAIDNIDIHNTTVDSNLEETINSLMELENEFIPIISKLQSNYQNNFNSNSQSSPLLPSSSSTSSSSLLSSSSHAPKISLSSFNENDLALFFPTAKGDYLAFNCGAPHHYLSAESKALIGQDKHFRKIYVLGKIIFKEEKIATEEDSPYSLAPGIKYYEISVSSISSLLSPTNTITPSTLHSTPTPTTTTNSTSTSNTTTITATTIKRNKVVK